MYRFSLAAFLMLASSIAGAQPAPEVNGLMYGDGDSALYKPYAQADGGRGTVYTYVEDGILYAAVVVSPSVNDNVFGDRQIDDDYLASAGWGVSNPSHKALDLMRSEHIELSLTCDGTTWTWRHDLLHDVDTDEDPLEHDWLSTPDGPDGGGSPPPGLVSASSTQWNFNNSNWDVTLGGTRSRANDWKSPDDGSRLVTSLNYPYHDAVYGWEWPIVYEMSVPLGCIDKFVLQVVSAHNSPPKDGEEDVPIQPMDYGDADGQFFPTLQVDDPARHILRSGYYLGVLVDADVDGHPDGAALGDDKDGLDDEDGVEFLGSWGPGSEASMRVTASAAGRLDAWIDFSADGDWDDPGEHVCADVALSPGANLVTITVPSDANIAQAFARFRFSSVGDLPYGGVAPDGEVEDYLLGNRGVPVELGSLSATYTDDAVMLAWTTHSESENLGFRVLRAQDPRGEYEELTSEMILGAGNSATVHHYTFRDAAVRSSLTYYYLLVDVSFEGVETTHGPVQVAIPAENPVTMALQPPMPNPVRSDAVVRYSLASPGAVRLSLYDTAGRERQVLAHGPTSAGEFSAPMGRTDHEGARLGAGMYVLVLQTPTGRASEKVIVID